MKEYPDSLFARAVSDAIGILAAASRTINRRPFYATDPEAWALRRLDHAIRYLAHPDRAVYPKTRRGTKRRPIRIA